MNLKQLFEPYSPPETNFLERLRYWAVAVPDRIAYRFLDGDEVVAKLTYAQLDEQARALSARLVSQGFAGKRALLMYPPGLDFIVALFGCYCAGIAPVPAYPPSNNRKFYRVNTIADDVQASVALTTVQIKKQWRNTVPSDSTLNRMPWLSTEDTPIELANDWINPKISPSDLGLIQYTSGSTGNPKGVMLSHDNLIANSRMITRAFGMTRTSSGCSWLPAFHDMGLIGGILNPLFCGIENTLMSPMSFLTQPIRWLRAISRFGATACGGPNFAYAWCTMKIKTEECKGLDLSTWSVAFNGAEPVRADVMDQFSEKFKPFGFDPKAFYPCYGMAETTLIATGGKKDEAPIVRPFNKHELVEHRVVAVPSDHKSARMLVGCGQVLQEEEVLIVHPETRHVLPDDHIGEIWINSPSCGLGYWNRPTETAETFHARLSPDNGKNYVRSGDLGFMDRGELFIAGRLKDMIIVRGVNHYPQDIEATVEGCHKLTRAGGCAAFALTRWDREHLVVVCEIERSEDTKDEGKDFHDEILATIRKAVTEEHDLPPDAIVLVRALSIPKTSSGKVQRHACKRNFENNSQMKVIARWVAWEEAGFTPPNAVAESGSGTNGKTSQQEIEDSTLSPVVVQSVIRTVKDVGKYKGVSNVDLDTNILLLGLDSVERMDIAGTLEAEFGGRIPDEVLQSVETVREVAYAIQTHIGTEPVLRAPESYYQLESWPEYLRHQEQQETLKATGLRNPYFSVHEGRIADTTIIEGRELISFASYNYLGLSGHPDVSTSAIEAIKDFGTSVSASRIVSGEKTIHKTLEAELSEFLGVGDVITFPGGHATNETVIGHLLGREDLIVHDQFAHNSITQGAVLSGARRLPFRHNDWEHLNEILVQKRSSHRRVLVAIEGLYSMDGDYPDLPKFVEVKNKHKCWLYVDEAHSIGTLGDTGRGLAEVYDVPRNDVECWMGTLSKSFGSCGGFVGGSKELIEFLRYTTPGYMFAAGMPPANVGAALGSLRYLRSHPELVQKLQANAKLFLDLANSAGINTGLAQGTAIIPIVTGDSVLALNLAESIFQDGINAQPIIYPAVAKEEARIRIFMTAAHTESQIRNSVEVIAHHWHRLISGDTSRQEVGV